MIDPAEAYTCFYQAMQCMTDMFDYIQSMTCKWDEEIEDFANMMEDLADRTHELVVEKGWQAALLESGIRELWDEVQKMFTQECGPHFGVF